ncbi:phosphopantetheine-binding protein, partial [Mycobacterium szulgai]|uniref:phosphopantetheine-binding protein n=1 Tax=Mycobacterium szulgai TaxID=1787 RepID=UPI0021F2C394
PKTALAQRLANLTPTQQHELLTQTITTQLAQVLGHNPHDINPHTSFQDLGFDSLTALELRNRLKTTTGLTLPATLIFDYPTPTTLAQHLNQQLSEGSTPGSPPLEAELARLEEMLPAIDDGDKQRVATRLRNLLSLITNSEKRIGERIQAAETIDEVFRLIDAGFDGE